MPSPVIPAWIKQLKQLAPSFSLSLDAWKFNFHSAGSSRCWGNHQVCRRSVSPAVQITFSKKQTRPAQKVSILCFPNFTIDNQARMEFIRPRAMNDSHIFRFVRTPLLEPILQEFGNESPASVHRKALVALTRFHEFFSRLDELKQERELKRWRSKSLSCRVSSLNRVAFSEIGVGFCTMLDRWFGTRNSAIEVLFVHGISAQDVTFPIGGQLIERPKPFAWSITLSLCPPMIVSGTEWEASPLGIANHFISFIKTRESRTKKRNCLPSLCIHATLLRRISSWHQKTTPLLNIQTRSKVSLGLVFLKTNFWPMSC